MQYPHSYLQIPWFLLAVVWAVTALATKRTVRVEATNSWVGHLVTIAVVFGLLFREDWRIGLLAWRVIPVSLVSFCVGLALTAAGVFFAIWARLYLGGNWSSIVTIKQDHTLVRSGPYAIVRHPIYSGLLLSTFGTAIGFGELGCFLAVAMAFAAWLAKARVEEQFMAIRFGEAYEAYRRQVCALIPRVI